MKIAILTQPLLYNYGGILQNYALQCVLKNLGHDPITFDQVDWLPPRKIRIKRAILSLLFKKKAIQTNNNNTIDRFKSQHINSTPKAGSYWDIKRLYWKYKPKAIIVGSDQVWRPQYNWGKIDKMFLSFIPNNSQIKRIAYAASFGVDEWCFSDAETKSCSSLIQRFDAVSTREIDGIDLCKKYLNRNDVLSVLDPTMLLEREDYLDLCSDVPTVNDKILFAYILDVDDNTKEELENIAHKYGLNLIFASAHSNCTLSIEEWLAKFRDAKMVITDSFHGTIFSIIFNKEFYTLCNESRGKTRFISLLSQFNLQDRLYNDVKSINQNTTQINWIDINNIKSTLQNKSFTFLSDNLNNNA